MNLLFQDDLHVPQDYELQDRAPRTISRTEIQDMMAEFLNRGGKIEIVDVREKKNNGKAQWNFWYRAKDGSNLVRQAPSMPDFVEEKA